MTKYPTPGKSGRLIILSAPSGAGKTTLCARLLQDFAQLTLSTSSTTRAPRGQEQHGKEYFFLTREDFETAIAAGRFAEHARVHDHYYGTSCAVIEGAWAQGKSVLLDIDVQGAESLKQKYPAEAVRIFISPPSLEVLEQRLRARGTDAEATIRKRLKNAEYEMTHLELFDYVVVNDDLDAAYAKLKLIVSSVLNGAIDHEGGI